MSRYYCKACETPILLDKNGKCRACKTYNHKAVRFSTVISTTTFKDLHGDWFFKMDSVRARNRETEEIINFPAEQIVYQ